MTSAHRKRCEERARKVIDSDPFRKMDLGLGFVRRARAEVIADAIEREARRLAERAATIAFNRACDRYTGSEPFDATTFAHRAEDVAEAIKAAEGAEE